MYAKTNDIQILMPLPRHAMGDLDGFDPECQEYHVSRLSCACEGHMDCGNSAGHEVRNVNIKFTREDSLCDCTSPPGDIAG
jgi:hypothetical protein